MNWVLIWHWFTLASPWGAVGGLVLYLERKFKPELVKVLSVILTAIREKAPVVVKEAEKVASVAAPVIHGFEKLFGLPIFAPIVAKEKLTADHVIKELEKTQIGQIAGKVYAAFRAKFGPLSGMSGTQQGSLIDVIKAEAAKLGLTTVEQQDIAAILKDIATGTETIYKEVVPQVEKTTAAVDSLKGAQAVPATQTAPVAPSAPTMQAPPQTATTPPTAN